MKKSPTNDYIRRHEVTPTMQKYLKVIFNLNQTKKMVRVKDIAKELDARMSSVTNMLRLGFPATLVA